MNDESDKTTPEVAPPATTADGLSALELRLLDILTDPAGSAETNLGTWVDEQLELFRRKKRDLLLQKHKQHSTLESFECLHALTNPYGELMETLDHMMTMVGQDIVDSEYIASLRERIETQRALLTFDTIFSLEGLHVRRTSSARGQMSGRLKKNAEHTVHSILQGECAKSLLYHHERLPKIAHDIERMGRHQLDNVTGSEGYEQYIRSQMAVAETVARYNKIPHHEAYIAPANLDANHKTDILVLDRNALSQRDYETVLQLLRKHTTTQQELYSLNADVLHALTTVQVKSRFAHEHIYKLFRANGVTRDEVVTVEDLLDTLRAGNPQADIPSDSLDAHLQLHIDTQRSALVPTESVPYVRYTFTDVMDEELAQSSQETPPIRTLDVAGQQRPLVTDRELVRGVVNDTCDPGTRQMNCDVVIVETGEIGKLLGGSREHNRSASAPRGTSVR